MKRAICFILTVCMMLSLGITGVYADDEPLYAVEGEELLLFDEGGVKLSLTGDWELIGDSQLQLSVVAENSTDATVRLYFTGTVNGWTISKCLMGGTMGNGVMPQSKAKGHLWFQVDDIEASDYADLEEMHLSFEAEDGDTFETIADPLAECTVYFNTEPPAEDAAPAGETAETAAGSSGPYSREVTLPAKEYATLDVGSSGSAAMALQQALIDQGFLDGTADGAYGSGTAAAVQAFQKSVGLEATGVADAQTQRALYGESDEGRIVTVTLTGTWKTEHMTMEGLFVDQSAVSQSDPDLVLLYLFYTVSAGDEGIAVNSGDTGVVVGENTYACARVPGSSYYMPNYYYGGDMKDVAAGGKQKVMETAWVSREALEAGGAITLSGTDAPDGGDIELAASDVLWLDSAQEVAQAIDMGGYQDITKNVMSIGDTITTDEYEFTLNNVEFTYELLPPNTGGYYYSYPAPSGKVYLHIDASVKNLMKRDLRIKELFSPGATYSEGYTYSGSVVVNDGDNNFDWVSSYVAATPLETCHAHGLVECPAEVEQNDDYLCATVKLSNGETYKYIVRTGDGF